MKLGISSAKTIMCQLKWLVDLDREWRFLVDMLIHLKCIRFIELNRCEINYSINDCQLNNNFHDFHLHKLSILRG